MSQVDSTPLATYNSLMDRHLAGYFCNHRRRQHLVKNGLINSKGEVISENTYRLNMARKEHKKHVKDLLAQAIVHKALDWERIRQVKIKQKLEEISKIELVRRIRTECNRQGDEEILPYLTLRGNTVDGSSPRSAQGRDYDKSEKQTGILIDDDGCPICKRDDSASNASYKHRPRSSKRGTKSKYPKEEIDSRSLYALDNVALYEYNMRHHEKQNEQGRASTYLTPVISVKKATQPIYRPQPPRSAKSDSRRSRPTTADKKGYLHRPEPPMAHPDDVRSGAEVTIKYYGDSLKLAYEVIGDPRHNILVEQQPFGGNTLIAFKKPIMPGDTFSFISTRHRGFPFSLTFYVNGVQNCRLSACCEFKHKPGLKIGGKAGHFGLISANGGIGPCYKCQLDGRGGSSGAGKSKDRKGAESSADRHSPSPRDQQHSDRGGDSDKDSRQRRPKSRQVDHAETDDVELSSPSGMSSPIARKDEATDSRASPSSDRHYTVEVEDEEQNDAKYESEPESMSKPMSVTSGENTAREFSPTDEESDPNYAEDFEEDDEQNDEKNDEQPKANVAKYESEPESLNRPVSVTSGEDTTRDFSPTDEDSDPVEDFPIEGSVLSMVGDKRDVDISDVVLSKKQVDELAQIIKSRDNIVSIVLRNTSLADNVATICDAIKVSPSAIKMLNLNMNKINATGMNSVTNVMRSKCASLEMLLLHGNPIGDEGIALLADTIADLHNGRNSPHLIAARQVVRGVMEELDTSIESSENGLQLRHLDIGDTKVGPNGASHIARIIAFDTKISSLSLTGSTSLGAKGLKIVSEALMSNTNLKKFSADYTGVKDSAVEILCDCLKSHRNIECLDLEGNNFSDRGARALIDLIGASSTLKKLKLLPGNSISDDLLDEIQDALRNN